MPYREGMLHTNISAGVVTLLKVHVSLDVEDVSLAILLKVHVSADIDEWFNYC